MRSTLKANSLIKGFCLLSCLLLSGANISFLNAMLYKSSRSLYELRVQDLREVDDNFVLVHCWHGSGVALPVTE